MTKNNKVRMRIDFEDMPILDCVTTSKKLPGIFKEIKKKIGVK
jgi:hypothetical protein